VNGRTSSPSIAMGALAASQDNGVLRTLLGSCLGVALYDRRLKVGGLSHIVLPDSLGRTDQPGKFADTAIPALIRAMQELVPGEMLKLTAKVAGGANMFSATGAANTIGVQNAGAVERILADLRIPILARHCGGEQGRRMALDTGTGLVTIDVVGQQSVTL
jgi:chemotaxis protein CheD